MEIIAAVISALTTAERLAAEHPDLANLLISLAQRVIAGHPHDDLEARRGLAAGIEAEVASAVVTAQERARRLPPPQPAP